uniref:Uncharacterized protein n=1 Tax=Anguilla anguilla TaxID=7936 RepID=A0A0E9PV45_ANGAN
MFQKYYSVPPLSQHSANDIFALKTQLSE